jgi:hypothetical protein
MTWSKEHSQYTDEQSCDDSVSAFYCMEFGLWSLLNQGKEQNATDTHLAFVEMTVAKNVPLLSCT